MPQQGSVLVHIRPRLLVVLELVNQLIGCDSPDGDFRHRRRITLVYDVGCVLGDWMHPASSPHLWTRLLTYNYLYSLNALNLVFPRWICYDWGMDR